jgi:hypothetical protein
MIDVVATDAFVAWYDKVSIAEALVIEHAVAHIELQGESPTRLIKALGAQDRVQVHELHIRDQGHDIRICFVTDPLRRAVLLVGGDNTGHAQFCESFVLRAEELWEEYLRGNGNGHGTNGGYRRT